MPKFIHHPADIPIEIIPLDGRAIDKFKSSLVCGGVACRSTQAHAIGIIVQIRIQLVHPVFEALGIVKWCQKNNNYFELGIAFIEQNNQFKFKMVEQVCHIEHYKSQALIKHGRLLSKEQAAIEWIEKFAANFFQEDNE